MLFYLDQMGWRQKKNEPGDIAEGDGVYGAEEL